MIGGDIGGMEMQVVYYKLFDLLKERGIMQKTISGDLKISGAVMQNLRHNKGVTTETIGKICEYLQCQPSDIMEVIYDTDVIKKQKEKAEIQAYIAELQEQLKKI